MLLSEYDGAMHPKARAEQGSKLNKVEHRNGPKELHGALCSM